MECVSVGGEVRTLVDFKMKAANRSRSSKLSVTGLGISRGMKRRIAVLLLLLAAE